MVISMTVSPEFSLPKFKPAEAPAGGDLLPGHREPERFSTPFGARREGVPSSPRRNSEGPSQVHDYLFRALRRREERGRQLGPCRAPAQPGFYLIPVICSFRLRSSHTY